MVLLLLLLPLHPLVLLGLKTPNTQATPAPEHPCKETPKASPMATPKKTKGKETEGAATKGPCPIENKMPPPPPPQKRMGCEFLGHSVGGVVETEYIAFHEPRS